MSDRVAILVIHGMGAQKPYETLDQFARGVCDVLPEQTQTTYSRQILFRDHPEDPTHQQKAWTQAIVRLSRSPNCVQTPEPYSHSGPELVDLIEYYWAPIINGRVKVLQSLRFLILSALSPFKYLRANMLVIDEISNQKGAAAARLTRQEGFSNSRIGQISFILLREVARACLVFFPMILLLVGIYGLMAQPLLSALSGGYKSDWLSYFWAGPKPSAYGIVRLIATLLRWLLLGMCFKYLWEDYSHPEPAPSNMKPLIIWSWMIRGLALFLLVLPLLFSMLVHLINPQSIMFESRCCSVHAFRIFVHEYIAAAPPDLHLMHLAGYAGLALLLYFLNLFLTTAIGGLAVYLGSDELNVNFEARSQILSECSQTVSELLGPFRDLSPEGTQKLSYDRILIAAHSLGSVIAYDVLNDLIAKHLDRGERDISTTLPLDRVAGLFTFGCPLNKVYYFFRTRTEQKTTVLNQILYALHSFRVRTPMPSGSALISAPFSKDFRWLNAWCRRDVISGRMVFYQADQNRVISQGFEPATAHIGYWKNPLLYRFFIELIGTSPGS